MCLTYAVSCLSACHDLSSTAIVLSLPLPCNCPCPQRLNPHLEAHLAGEAAATYWADPLSPAKLIALVCAAQHPHLNSCGGQFPCALFPVKDGLLFLSAAVSGEYTAWCIADTLVFVCHAGHEPSPKRLDELEI